MRPWSVRSGNTAWASNALSGGALAGLLISAACMRTIPMGGEDRSVLPQASDLAAIVSSLEVDPKFEQFSKKLDITGQLALSYNYHTPPGKSRELFFRSAIQFARDAAAAKTGYATLITGVSIGVSVTARGSVTLEERPGALTWGDERSCRSLVKERRDRGITCTARKGRILLILTITGGNFDYAPLTAPGGMDRIIESRLSALGSYDPTAGPEPR